MQGDALRRLLVPLLLIALLGTAWAEDPKPPEPPPRPRGHREPPPPLGGPPPGFAPAAGCPAQPWVSPPSTGGKAERIQHFGWDDWQEWWELNLGPYESLKACIYRRQVAAWPKPLFPGEPEHHLLGRWTRGKVEQEILPALVRVLETNDPYLFHTSVRLHALLSLGKLAREESHVRLLLRWTHRPRVSGTRAKARALLSLGLLRRTHPEDRFPAPLLDEVRALLFAWLRDPDDPMDARRAAAVALGLLGDQPTANGETGHRRHAARLFECVAKSPADSSLTPTVLLAIGQLAPGSTSHAQRELLRGLAWKRGGRRPPVAPEVKAWATWALGRVGTAKDVALLRRIIQRPRFSVPPQRWCAALALGSMGRRLSGDDRKTVARALRESLASTRDGALRGYLLVGLGQSLAAAVATDQHDAYEPWMAHTPIFEALRTDQGASRGYAALALGFLARSIGAHPSRERAVSIRAKALEALGRALDDERHPRTQAAAAVALGLAQDRTARTALLGRLMDDEIDARIPPAAAWGLGLLHDPTKEMATRLMETARSVMYGRLRQRSLRALALLGHPRLPDVEGDAIDVLLRELDTSETQEERWEVITLLGRVGDDRAIGPLLAILASKERTGWEQGAAVLALGCVGDLQEETAFDRLRRGVHYRSSTTAFGLIRFP